jgi:hypothetical protein
MRFRKKRFVVGIGAQKTGTSWLHRYLAGRQEIFMPMLKELHYFDVKYRPDLFGHLEKKLFVRRLRKLEHLEPSRSRLIAEIKARLEMGNDDQLYKAFFRERASEVDFFGEVTPSYALLHTDGLEAIRALFPNVRIIFTMRDPIERFFSQVRMRSGDATRKGLNGPAFAEACLGEPDFVERSQYETTIRNIEAAFPRNGDIKYLFYEKMFRPESVAEICSFIGVPYVPANLTERVGSTGARQPYPAELERKVRDLLAPTYDFCRAKFGEDLPPEWAA